MIRRRTILPLAVLSIATTMWLIAASAAVAAAPGWQVLGVTGPTNLPPAASEIQTVAVDADGGTFTLSFQLQTSQPLGFDASAADVAAALNGLSSISGAGGRVEVSGGPGDAGATRPYFVRFAGSLAGTDVPQLTADSTLLTGGAGATAATATPGGTAGAGTLEVVVFNVGAAPSSGAVTLHIGPLPAGIATGSTAPTGAGWDCPTLPGQSSVTCTRTLPVLAGAPAAPVNVPITVGPAAAGTSLTPISVEGGGASAAGRYEVPVRVSSQPASPGIQAMWAGAFDANGEAATQAGGHPFSAGIGFLLNTILSPRGEVAPAGDLKDAVVELPPGFVGNPMVTGRCPGYELTGGDLKLPKAGTECPITDSVGFAYPALEKFGGYFQQPEYLPNFPVYNGEPKTGYAAQFAFPFTTAEQMLMGSLRSDSDYGITIAAPNVPLFYKVFGAFTMLHGNPAGAGGKAFLTNPTNCSEEALTTPLTTLAVNTYQQASIFDRQAVEIPAVTGCDGLQFEPRFSFQPSTHDAQTVTAAVAELSVPQDGLLDPAKLASPHLKRSVVTLPEGLTLNPSAVNGLEACSTQQIGLKGTNFPMPNPIRFDESHPSCPDGSKIGTAELQTPLLPKALEGTVYLAAQDDNPFNSLLAIYLVIDDAKTGVVVKLPGELKADPRTGQLTAVFDDNPQLPFSDLTLRFRGGGPHSTLATPDVCGTYTTRGEFTPWSAPESGAAARTEDSFAVSQGVGGSACPSSKAERPFGPGFSAGTNTPEGGAFSPFSLRITRPDGNQELDRVNVTTPPGFAAALKGVAICSDAALAAATSRKGTAEMADPSCPASSQVGTTTIGVGVGSDPYFVKTGKVYLTGPHEGAPASLAFIVPAVAGPFDLGVQVVRAALNINPKTAQVTAKSDPIPQILKGIPLQIRDIRVDLDRANFTLNPTNCQVMSINGQIQGGSGAVANVAGRFQVGGCSRLGFKPNLSLRFFGPTRRGGYQRLRATLTARKGDANIARASVALPHSAFLAQEHIGTVCTRVQFAARACPRRSIYGYATATTPLLDAPLSGPVYLRSSDNTLPDLVAALRGPDVQPIEIELSSRTDSIHGGIRNTFDVVPDAPVTRFTLNLLGNKKSLIVNSRNLCKGVQRATVRFDAQNGKVRKFRPVIKNDCGKKAKKRSGHSHHGRLLSGLAGW